MIQFLLTSGQAIADAAGPRLASKNYQGALEIAKAHPGSHLASFIVTGVETCLEKYREGYHESKAAEFANRALEHKSEQLSTNLHRGMNILASTGSTAPFIGLLGTVLGILNAFRLVGATYRPPKCFRIVSRPGGFRGDHLNRKSNTASRERVKHKGSNQNGTLLRNDRFSRTVSSIR